LTNLTSASLLMFVFTDMMSTPCCTIVLWLLLGYTI
jgi:hypothetical protein